MCQQIRIHRVFQDYVQEYVEESMKRQKEVCFRSMAVHGLKNH